MVYVFYTFYTSVDLAHHEKFHAKVGKGGIICYMAKVSSMRLAFVALV